MRPARPDLDGDGGLKTTSSNSVRQTFDFDETDLNRYRVGKSGMTVFLVLQEREGLIDKRREAVWGGYGQSKRRESNPERFLVCITKICDSNGQTVVCDIAKTHMFPPNVRIWQD